METGLLSRKEAIAEKIISIKETLEALELLKEQKVGLEMLAACLGFPILIAGRVAYTFGSVL